MKFFASILFLLALVLLNESVSAQTAPTAAELFKELKGCSSKLRDPDTAMAHVIDRAHATGGTLEEANVSFEKLREAQRDCHRINAHRTLEEFRKATDLMSREVKAATFSLHVVHGGKRLKHYALTREERDFIRRAAAIWWKPLPDPDKDQEP